MAESEDIRASLEILERMRSDESVPRNIRRAADKASETLQDESLDRVVKVSKALNALEGVIGDPNIPIHARTQIWNVASQLEAASN